MKSGQKQLLVSVVFIVLSLTPPAEALVNNEVQSQHIREADGTSGQDANTGAGVKTPHIQNSAVTAPKIGANAVTTTKIKNAAVTPAKISYYGNVAIVAPSGGDYNNPATAMAQYTAWCQDAGDTTTPCLLKIMPGTYNVGTSSVVMKPFIDIEGSGENVTIIKGTIDSPISGVVTGASNAEMRSLSAENSGGGTYAIAISNNNTSPAMANVRASASGGSNNFGIYNDASSPAMTNVTAAATGGTYSWGVYNRASSSPAMVNVIASGSGGSVWNIGVYNHTSCSPEMINVTAAASGGPVSMGMYNINSSSPVMTSVTSTGSGGTEANIGIRNYNASSPIMMNVTAAGLGTNGTGVHSMISGAVKINHSVIRGATKTIHNDTGVATRVGNSQLEGGAVYNAGTLTCAGVYDENYIFYATSCP